MKGQPADTFHLALGFCPSNGLQGELCFDRRLGPLHGALRTGGHTHPFCLAVPHPRGFLPVFMLGVSSIVV